MKILHHPDTLLHDVPELTYSSLLPSYETPARVTSILTALESYDITIPPLSPGATLEAAELIHPPDYLHHLRTIHRTIADLGVLPTSGAILPECFPPRNHSPHLQPPADPFARLGYYAFDLCTALMESSYTSIIASADLARQAALSLYTDPETLTFAMCRPPGHHCGPQMAGGYCYLNNTAIAVAVLRSQLAAAGRDEQITILDIDFHHGNGTQEIFYGAKQPAYISIHGRGEFPYYSGYEGETGKGVGVGYNLNFPLPVETEGEVYVETLRKAVGEVARLETRWLVVSWGGDTVEGDPVGRFKLRPEEYRGFGEVVGQAGCAVLVVLEGGYRVGVLGECLKGFVEGVEYALERVKEAGGWVGPEAGVVVAAPGVEEPAEDEVETEAVNGI